MSRISGHYRITRRALFELRREDPQDVFIRDFQNAGVAGALSDDDLARVFFLDRRHIEAVATIGFNQEHIAPKAMVFMLPSSPFVTTMCDAVTDLADGAVCKDLEDIVDGAHWSPTRQAQAGHFMRAPADRPQDAYTAALLWIRRNVDDASAAMSAAYGTLALGPTDLHGHRHGRNLPAPGSGRLTGGRAAKFLGRAVHCVQDSFSSSHVQRGRGTEKAPGNIEDIFVYTQQDPKVHEVADREWMVKRRPDQSLGGNDPRPARLSHTGVEAVNATKALISLTVWAAAHRKAEIEMTERWGHFRAQWLACAPSFGV